MLRVLERLEELPLQRHNGAPRNRGASLKSGLVIVRVGTLRSSAISYSRSGESWGWIWIVENMSLGPAFYIATRADQGGFE
jgi:hypothetical protein